MKEEKALNSKVDNKNSSTKNKKDNIFKRIGKKFKEVFSELKKVQWPSFGKACKQTGTVLVVVAVFMLAVLGIDSLVTLILNLIGKI